MYFLTRQRNLSKFLTTTFLIFKFAPNAFCGETIEDLARELNRLIDSSKVSVVTVVARVSHEIYVEKESGILSFFKPERQKQAISYVNVGTGLIVDKEGHIVTRSSIVSDADYSSVTLANGEEIPAKFIGHDPETGFAVIKIAHADLKPAHFGRSEGIRPGSWIVMIGNSLGAFPSIDFGAINGLRSDGLIQISANLNPGNNGSPIISLKGEVIALVAGRINAQEHFVDPFKDPIYSGITLAYPIDWIKRIVEDLIQVGYVRKGWLGVVGYYDDRQPKIREIKENSPAQRAGLTKGDVIMNYADFKVENISELIRLVEYTSPGQTVTVEFMRDEKILKTDIEIGEKSRPTGSELSRRSPPTVSITNYGTTAAEVPQRFPLDLFEQNRLLEKRIERLEAALFKLQRTVQSK